MYPCLNRVDGSRRGPIGPKLEKKPPTATIPRRDVARPTICITRRSDDPENQHHKSPLFSKPPASYENALARSLSDKPSGARASWRSVRRHVIVLPQGPEEEVEEAPEEEEEQEDPEMAQALRDACFEAARIAANDSSERPTKTAFAIFKETSMKAAVLTQCRK